MILNFVPSTALSDAGIDRRLPSPVAPIVTSCSLASSIVATPDVCQVTSVELSEATLPIQLNFALSNCRFASPIACASATERLSAAIESPSFATTL